MSHTVQQHWPGAATLHKKIREYDSFSMFVKNEVKALDQAFVLQDMHLRCVDEGTPGGIRMAGSGILGQDTARKHLRGKVTGVYSHAGCGAAAKHAAEQGITDRHPDEVGKEWSRKLAAELGVPYKGHITHEELKRPTDLHNAIVVYYDGTGRFDPSGAKGLPAGFVVSRRHLPLEYALDEAQLCASIAFGPHGLGEFFTAQSPLIMVAIGDAHDREYSLTRLQSELETIIGQYLGRVVVDGFTAPASRR